MKEFCYDKSNIFNPVLRLRVSVVQSHAVVKLTAALVYDGVKESEEWHAGVGRHFKGHVV